MTKIEEKIKALFRVKAKIGLYEQVLDFTSNLEDSKEHKGLAKEVQEEIGSAIVKIMDKLESAATSEKPGQATEEVNVQEVEKKTSTPKAVPVPKNPPQTGLVEFVSKYGKKFGFKKISGLDGLGKEVTGVVRKIEYPNLLVETEEGKLVEVDPETAKVEG